jgi:probable addiction module antidote protein
MKTNDNQDLAAVLSKPLATGDVEKFLDVLGQIVKAAGVAEVAATAGLSRESLYKVFRPGASPRHETIVAVLTALGLKFTAQTITTR